MSEQEPEETDSASAELLDEVGESAEVEEEWAEADAAPASAAEDDAESDPEDDAESDAEDDAEDDAEEPVVPDAPSTGSDEVDEVIARLGAVEELGVHDHVAVFEEAHQSLRRALDSAG
ncbi:hypothetical protein [Nocardioides mangrovicus]|uniref:hypothetical protein n=1 Tax=Nocardioides mangrovicus TaxID=2478913 RepID=UPI001314A289|nr:hypothetical protein [Nocardioides mangrovicus]